MRDNELETLSKYQRGAIVVAGDMGLLERFASMGYCRIGFTTNTEDGTPRETARLTPRGLREVKRERIYRSPLKKFLYAVRNSIFG